MRYPVRLRDTERLGALRLGGHDDELADGDALNDQQPSDLYMQALSPACADNYYRIRKVFGGHRHGGRDHLGFGAAVLLVSSTANL